MDIARRFFHLRNRERCQKENTLRLGSPLAPLASSRDSASVISPKENLEYGKFVTVVKETGEGKAEKIRLRACLPPP